ILAGIHHRQIRRGRLLGVAGMPDAVRAPYGRRSIGSQAGSPCPGVSRWISRRRAEPEDHPVLRRLPAAVLRRTGEPARPGPGTGCHFRRGGNGHRYALCTVRGLDRAPVREPRPPRPAHGRKHLHRPGTFRCLFGAESSIHDTGMNMDDNRLNRRRLLGGMAAAGAAGIAAGLTSREAGAAQAQAPVQQPANAGASQAPTITSVKDKVVYITGGSSGIGLGIARVMHEAGAKVAIGNLDDKQWADALKNFPANDPRLMTVVHDVMDKDGWSRAADEIEKKFGPVHILVNNAGVGLQQSASGGTVNDWEWGMGVNFWGPVYGVTTFVPRMRAHGQ